MVFIWFGIYFLENMQYETLIEILYLEYYKMYNLFQKEILMVDYSFMFSIIAILDQIPCHFNDQVEFKYKNYTY